MKSRARAAAFAGGALLCALLSAAVASSGGGAEDESYGPLTAVVVTSEPLERGVVIGRSEINGLEERRVPQSFVPPDAVSTPAEALGRKLGAPLPAGSYVTVSSFAVRAPRAAARPGQPPQGTTPVEITVTGAGALASARTDPGDRVDVIVAGDSAPGPSRARTYVAATGVPLLALREAPPEPGVEERWTATLAVTRDQALKLIRAESEGAQVRLLAG